jgi:hypothetical protein
MAFLAFIISDAVLEDGCGLILLSLDDRSASSLVMSRLSDWPRTR